MHTHGNFGLRLNKLWFSEHAHVCHVNAWLGAQAEGTTLGADNGIGVAAALALLDMPQSAKLPPLECLFTIDEETGLTGTCSLDRKQKTVGCLGILGREA